MFFFFFSSRRRHTRCYRDWSSDVCSSDLGGTGRAGLGRANGRPATSVKPRNTPPWSIEPPSIRSDTLPDWRPEPGSLARPAPAGPRPGARPGRVAAGWERLLSVPGWPLAVVLAIQAALSLRLVWSATAFLDEGEYLTVGRLELAHLLHHAPMPDVATYLSGSPIVYPPLAAIADDVGGLAGARLLSLVFML